MTLPDEKYISLEYITDNPTWDAEDSPWKLKKILDFIYDLRLPTRKICEVGCGSGAVLDGLRDIFPDSLLYGFDIAPSALQFWKKYRTKRISFTVGDFLIKNKEYYDIILLLDVVEHLRDPFYFLDQIKSHSSYFLFHFPLDMSAISVFRETPLLNVRKKVGHIHYYTKNLVLALLNESGFEVLKWRYTNASFSISNRSLKTKFADIPRQLFYCINKDMGVRLLGGETLLILAKPATNENL